MSVDLSPIDADLLKTLTDVHGIPDGAYNIRKDGELVVRNSSSILKYQLNQITLALILKSKKTPRVSAFIFP